MDPVIEVKARLSVEDVISEYVRLKRTGRNFKGLSPWTNEKTPSFVVSPEKQIWHDFSSGRGGDVFTFVQEVEGIDFKEALELLARKAGIDLDQFQKGSQSNGINKERLYLTLETAARFYQSQLVANKKALEYIRIKRAFSKQTTIDFRFGYSPPGQNLCSAYLSSKGFSTKEMKLAGLVVERGSKPTDMFRNRIMIPLADTTGRIIGFTARLLEDDGSSGPKYINTPSTPLYDKSRHVYGLHLAKTTIRDKGYSVLVEGNLDVVASYQSGQKETVATAGTALTEHQLKALSRFAPDVRLAFDQDRAGLEATERAIPIASKAGINLSVIAVPPGKDPDELIRSDPAAWKKAIKSADYAVDWIIKRYQEKCDLSTARGKKDFSDLTCNVLKDLTDPVEQDHYINLVAELSNIDRSALREKIKRAGQEAPRQLKPAAKRQPVLDDKTYKDWQRCVDRLLCLNLLMPGTRAYMDMLTTDMLTNDNQKRVFEFLKDNLDFDGNIKQIGPLKDIANFVKILALQFDELYASVDTLELQYEAVRLRAKIIEYYVKQQKTKLSIQLNESGEDKQKTILEAVRDLDKLLKKISIV